MQSRITEGPIWRHLLSFFFPILLGTFFQQLYNTVDAIIVGNFVGTEALAAVGGPAAVLINFLVNLFVGLSSGATVIVAQYYGARQMQELRRTVHTALALAIAAGLGIMILGIALSYPAMVLMGTPAEVMDYSLIYLRIYFVGSIASFLYNVGSSVLRAIGDTKRPLYFLIAACLTNIVLDLVFVVGFGLEVLGVALATVLSQMVSAVLVMLVLCRPDSIFCIARKEIRFHPDILKSILRIGLPTGLQSDMYTISNMLIQSCINSFGTNTMAAWTAFCKLDAFYWMISGAFGISITTFVGQNFGAGRLDRVRKGAGACMVIGVVLTASVGVVLYNGGHLLVELFTTDQQVQAISMDLLHFMVPTFITYIAIEILSGTLRGVGDAWMPLIITGIGVCAVRVLWIMFVLPHYHTIIGAAFCYPLTWSLTTVAFVIYYYFFSSLRRWKLKPLKKRFGVYKPF